MRVMYLLVGILLSFIVTNRVYDRVWAVVDKENDKIFLAAILTGYAEGWTRGRDHTEAKYRQLMYQYFKGWN